MTIDNGVLHQPPFALQTPSEWEALFNALPDSVSLIDAQYRITWVNATMADKLGLSPPAIIGRNCYELFHNLEAPPDYCPLSQVIASGNEHRLEVCEEQLGGHCSISLSPLKGSDGRIAGSIHVVRDINQLKEKEREEENSRSFLQSVIDGISESIFVIDRDYRVQLANRAALGLHTTKGKLPVATPYCYSLTHNSDTPCTGKHHPCPLQEVMASGQPATFIHRHTRADGRLCTMELTASPVFNHHGKLKGIVEVGRDITAQERLEAERKEFDSKLLQQQKDESIATLAGGIAHDFNNLLMVVLGNSEILQMHMAPENKDYEVLDHIITSADRMAQLVRQLLAYAKGGKYLPAPLSTTKIIEDSVGLVHRGKAAEIELVMNLPPDTWPILGDQGQISQALANIFTNSFEAMEQSGGSLYIQCANCVKPEKWECRQGRVHQAGDYVHIVVEDNGPGIPSNLHDKIFDPFFSTKFIGRGLGLSAANGIIQNHGGCFSLDTQARDGAAFHIFLPRLSEPAKGLYGEKETVAEPGNAILAVDDDPQVLQLVEAILLTADYTILTAKGGQEALDIFESKKDIISLVVLDIQMPGVDGKEVFARLKTMKPAVRVLVSSGYDKATAIEGLELGTGDTFVQKPYHRAALLKTVQLCLEGQPAGGGRPTP